MGRQGLQRRLVWIVVAGVALLALAATLSVAGVAGAAATWLLFAALLVWTGAVLLFWRSVSRYLLKRSTRYGLNAFLLSFLVLVILFLLGFVTDRHVWRRDLTATQEFSLSEKTLNVLQGLRKRIDIYVYYQPTMHRTIRDLLDEYTRRSSRLRVHFEDLNRNPELAENLGITELGCIAFTTEDKMLLLRQLSEEDVTNALIKVSRPGMKKVYFLTGHGEKEIDGKGVNGYAVATNSLRRENYEPLSLSLLNGGEIPPDCAVLVVAGPKSHYLEPELLSIRRYLEDGGRLLCLFDPRFTSGLEAYVAFWGIEVLNHRIVDPSATGQVLGKGATTPLVTHYGAHPITKGFAQPTYFPLARSLRPLALYRGRAETTVLASSGENSWSESDLVSREVGFDAEDLMGPVALAMTSRLDVAGLQPESEASLATPKPGDATVQGELMEDLGGKRRTESRLVVFGDSDFAANNTFNDMGNGNLFLNSVAWLAEDEDLIATRPRSHIARTVSLTPAQLRWLNIVSLAALPGLVALTGVLTLWRRRAQG